MLCWHHLFICTRRIAIADQLMNWIVKCKNLAIILKWPNMHETDCKMLDIDSDTNFIHFLLQEGIMKSVLMDWFYGNSGRQWSIKMWCTRLTILFSSINQYFLYIVFTSTLLCNFKQRSLLIIFMWYVRRTKQFDSLVI